MISEGTVLGERYRVGLRLARGGMSEVFVAHDELLDRDVAVKALRGDTGDPRRFEDEVRLLAGLDHPLLVKVFDVGEDDDQPYVVMELVGGTTLADLLNSGPVDAERVRSLAIDLTDALAYLHRVGVVHRDVKPSNILVDEHGRARLADFGIARVVDTTRLTVTGLVMGTPGYLVPEQVEGHECGPAADVYSLGLVTIECLTGLPPFEGTGTDVALARLRRAPDALAHVPDAWRPLLSAMTAREAGDRPSAAAVHDQLVAAPAAGDDTHAATLAAVATVAAAAALPVTAVMPVQAAPPRVAATTSRTRESWVRRRGAALAALAVLAAILAVAFLASRGGDDPQVVAQATSTTVAATTAPPTTAAPTTAAPTTTPPPTAPRTAAPAVSAPATECASIEQAKKNLDAQQHLIDQQYKGAVAAAAKRVLDQKKHDLDDASKNCH